MLSKRKCMLFWIIDRDIEIVLYAIDYFIDELNEEY